MLELVPIDAETFAIKLTELRRQHGESKEAAAKRIGVGLRQYVRWTSDDPTTPRISSITRVAEAYGMTPGEFLAWMDDENATLNDRLRRIEGDVREIRALLLALVPVVAAGEAAEEILAQLDREARSTDGTREPIATSSPAA